MHGGSPSPTVHKPHGSVAFTALVQVIPSSCQAPPCSPSPRVHLLRRSAQPPREAAFMQLHDEGFSLGGVQGHRHARSIGHIFRTHPTKGGGGAHDIGMAPAHDRCPGCPHCAAPTLRQTFCTTDGADPLADMVLGSTSWGCDARAGWARGQAAEPRTSHTVMAPLLHPQGWPGCWVVGDRARSAPVGN